MKYARIIITVFLVCAAALVIVSCGGGNDDPAVTSDTSAVADDTTTGNTDTPEKVMFTVNLNPNGGNFIKARKVAEGEKLKKITPIRAGYVFNGWYLGNEEYDFSVPVTSDMTLVAHWLKEDTNFYASSTKALTYSSSSAALNIVWKDHDNAADLRPGTVRCLLKKTSNGKTDNYYVTVSAGGASWESPSNAPEGVTLSSGAGNWTVRITGLKEDEGAVWSFTQEKLSGDYSTLQSGTNVTNTVKDYDPVNDETAKLTVTNGHLYDAAGNVIVLRGVVTPNVGTQKFLDCMSEKSLLALKESGVNCIRFTVQLSGAAYGYCFTDAEEMIPNTSANQRKLREDVFKAVDGITSLGLYAIVDWGMMAKNPNLYYKEALAFYSELAKKYANNPYVMYEICNEPNATWGTHKGEDVSIKAYAEKIISAIRGKGSEGVVIVAPNGSATALSTYTAQPVAGDDPVDNPISENLSWNVAYTFHCYPYNYAFDDPNATSYSWKLKDALEAGLTIITTEMSPMNASYSNRNELIYDMNETAKYIDLYLENDMSICYYKYYSPHFEGAEYSEWSMFVPGVDLALGEWGVGDMTVCGKWYYEFLRSDGYIKVADFKAERHK